MNMPKYRLGMLGKQFSTLFLSRILFLETQKTTGSTLEKQSFTLFIRRNDLSRTRKEANPNAAKNHPLIEPNPRGHRGPSGENRDEKERDLPCSSSSTPGGLIMRDDIEAIKELDEQNPELKEQLPPLYQRVVEELTS